jgi:His/Glu/Gln/Arg/opine family amino acid ABC transporter permease subunit
MSYQWHFDIVWSYRWLFVTGTAVTIGLTIAVVLLGLLIGLLAGIAQISRHPALRWISWLYIEMFRLTPLLVLLLWFYYALPMMTGIKLDALSAAVVTLALYGGSFYAEVIRGGIVSIEPGQSEGRARARHAAGARDAAHRAAAGDQADDSAADEPVDHPVQEHLAGLGAGGAGPALSGSGGRDGHLSGA